MKSDEQEFIELKELIDDLNFQIYTNIDMGEEVAELFRERFSEDRLRSMSSEDRLMLLQELRSQHAEIGERARGADELLRQYEEGNSRVGEIQPEEAQQVVAEALWPSGPAATADGFRYPNPVPRQVDADFDRFRDADQEHIHNPWPQLVDLEMPNVGFSQPLVQAHYVPSTTPAHLLSHESQSDFPLPTRLARYHEAAHQLLAFTPAKDLARFYLANSYAALEQALAPTYSVGDAEQLWVGLLADEQELTHIRNATLLSEGLLATSGGLMLGAALIHPRPPGGELTRVEAEWLRSQADCLNRLSPGSGEQFLTAYPAFSRMMSELNDIEPDIHEKIIALVKLAIILQPAGISDDGVSDLSRCTARLDDVLAAVENRHMTTEVMSILDDEAVSLDYADWNKLLSLSLLVHDDNSYFASLYDLTFRNRLSTEDDPSMFYRLVMMNRDFPEGFADIMVISYGREIRKHGGPFEAFIHPVLCSDDLTWYVDSKVESQSSQQHINLVLLEGIRQQIVGRRGLRCPCREDNTCVCAENTPDFRRAMNRLARFAMEGRFGPGHWSPLPLPCRQGF